MRKSSGLPPLSGNVVSGNEVAPAVKSGMTRRAALGALATPALLQPEITQDVAMAATGPVYPSVPDGEAATQVGQTFFVSMHGSLSARRRVGGGSVEIFSHATAAALASPSGAGMVGLPQGGSVDKAIKWVTPLMFGAVGDGVADDAMAVVAAMDSGLPVDWLNLTYRIGVPVHLDVSSKLRWTADDAMIVYDGTHSEYAVRIVDTAGVTIDISGLTIDGGKKCNNCFELRNNTNLSTASTFRARNLFVKRAKRINVFSGGAGLYVCGAFDLVSLVGGGVSDCELPAGQGTPSVVGIDGLSFDWYSPASYVRRVTLDGVSIERIYSSDPAYKVDQDGLAYFVPTVGGRKVPSLLVCKNSDFFNCFGRSIKTQIRTTIVRESSFSRSEGFDGRVGNPEIDSQTGDLIASDNVFTYTNGCVPSGCVGGSGSVGRSGLSALRNIVYLDDGMMLPSFARTFPAGGVLSSQLVEGNKIYGTVKRFFDYLCAGPDNFAVVKDNWVNDIALDDTGDRALVRVAANGVGPYGATVDMSGNVYVGGKVAALVRDNVPSIGMNATVTAMNNQGFVVRSTAPATAGGLKTNTIARLGRIGPLLDLDDPGDSYHETLSRIIGAGATETFQVNQRNGAVIFFASNYSKDSIAQIMSLGDSNLVIYKGADVEVGQGSEPDSGIFRFWRSADNEISVRNTDGAARRMMLFVAAVA